MSVARIPEEVVERLKAEVDLVVLVQAAGVVLKKAGADLVGCCPFHEDRTPSLVVTPEKGLWHCLGACQAGGSVIDWVMRRDGVSFRHAVELLREGIATAGDPAPIVPVRSSVRRLASPVEASAEDAALLAQVVDYYHATLLKSPEALDYLAARRIEDPETIEHFRLGYANRTLGLRLPQKNRKAGAEMRGRLEALGVFRSSGHEHLAGSLVVPVASPDGVVTDLYGRKITPNLRPGTALHLYLPGPHRGVFNAEALDMGEVILCESLLDALSFYSAGFRNVTSSYGTAGFTESHREAFRRHGVSRVLLAYDHDRSGDEAATQLAADLMADGIECFRVVFPIGTDANDVAVTASSPRDVFARLLRDARFLGGAAADEPRVSSSAASSVAPSRSDGPLASPVPPPTPAPAVTTSSALPARHDELSLEIGERRWRIRHLPKSPTPGSLRVNVMVSAGDRFHVDVLDLYAARARTGFLDATATELRTEVEPLKAELGAVLLAIEEAQAEAAREAVSPGTAPMSAEDREEALALLTDPSLMGRVAEAFSILGVVGETDACLVAWLVLTSRLSERPLGAVIQSSSSAGKSTLADAALALFPAEEVVAYSAMTGQALYYLGETDLAHKVLALAEEEGASRASYALKLLVSDGRLSIAAAGKDPVSGKLVTHTYEVQGPVALLMTTTATELEAELANRLVVLSVDEGRAQTRAVQAAQRHAETIEGLIEREERKAVTALHHNAQRLLAPLAVVNPHAPSLTFSDRSTRNRRDHAKLLGLVRAITLAHQHQREHKQVEVGGKTITYIEASTSDVALAERIFAPMLDATPDELAPIDAPSPRRDHRGSALRCARHRSPLLRRELRALTGLGDSQLKVHLARLVDVEHLVCHRAGPHTSYELDRPDEIADRPVPTKDRPVISRSLDLDPACYRPPHPSRSQWQPTQRQWHHRNRSAGYPSTSRVHRRARGSDISRHRCRCENGRSK